MPDKIVRDTEPVTSETESERDKPADVNVNENNADQMSASWLSSSDNEDF